MFKAPFMGQRLSQIVQHRYSTSLYFFERNYVSHGTLSHLIIPSSMSLVVFRLTQFSRHRGCGAHLSND